LFVSCPICQKRKAGRFCPAKAEKICAVCCGTEREVTIDCPADCAYLLSAHRYEEQHSHPLPANTPLLDVRLSSDIVHRHPQLLSGVAFTIAKFFAARTSRSVVAGCKALLNRIKRLRQASFTSNPPSPPCSTDFMLR